MTLNNFLEHIKKKIIQFSSTIFNIFTFEKYKIIRKGIFYIALTTILVILITNLFVHETKIKNQPETKTHTFNITKFQIKQNKNYYFIEIETNKPAKLLFIVQNEILKNSEEWNYNTYKTKRNISKLIKNEYYYRPIQFNVIATSKDGYEIKETKKIIFKKE